MKKCTTRRENKLDSEFTKDRSRKDGLNYICKICQSKKDKRYRENYKEEIRIRHEKYRETNKMKIKVQGEKYYENNKKRIMAYHKKYYWEHLKESRARGKFQHYIKKGAIIRQSCEICSEPKSEGHHPSYDKPLDVIWLCRKHHKREHSNVI